MSDTVAVPTPTYRGPERPEPFAPAGAQFESISPKLATVRLVGIGLRALILIPALTVGAYFLVANLNVPSYLPAVVAALMLAYYLWWAFIQVRRVRAFAYARTESELLIRRGIMFRSLTVIPYGRLQYVDVQEGPIERMVGLATVTLNTASGATAATIPGLPAADAAQLRDDLAARGDVDLAGL